MVARVGSRLPNHTVGKQKEDGGRPNAKRLRPTCATDALGARPSVCARASGGRSAVGHVSKAAPAQNRGHVSKAHSAHPHRSRPYGSRPFPAGLTKKPTSERLCWRMTLVVQSCGQGRPQGPPLPYYGSACQARIGYAKRLRPTCLFFAAWATARPAQNWGHVSNAGLAPALFSGHSRLCIAFANRVVKGVSFIRIKTPFLRKCATSPSAFSGWAFSHNVA